MPTTMVLNGNAAIARAVSQVNPDVITVYPAAPAAEISEHLASFAADGLINAEILNMESGHSAMSGCIGASAAGGRVFTSAASQSLAAMHEILFLTSSLRLPVVAAITNNALFNIDADHSGFLGERACGWLQIFSENPQEAYDNIIQAYKISEHMEVRIPVLVAVDGLLSSHSMENVLIEEENEITEFVGKFNPVYSLLDNDNPITVGSMSMSDYYFEHKVNQLQGIENSRRVIKEVGKEFGNRFGRYYGFFETYKLDDAEFALVLMGAATGTAKEWIDELRSKGEKIGLLKLRVLRPFPAAELREALFGLKAAAVLERVFVPGSHGGPVFNEIRSALYDEKKKPAIFPYIYGLGGRDIRMEHFETILERMKEEYEEMPETMVEVEFVNLRENND